MKAKSLVIEGTILMCTHEGAGSLTKGHLYINTLTMGNFLVKVVNDKGINLVYAKSSFKVIIEP
jgi:hypothetical protein